MTPMLLCVGLVVGISDGDTLKVRCPDMQAEPIRVRLAEIDAPEKGQPFGANARQALADLVFEKTVEVQRVDTDRYGRVVARLKTTKHPDVNFELVRLGLAWCYPKYLQRADECRSAESKARSKKRGLWEDPGAHVAPWEWRKARRMGGNDRPILAPAPR